ncbi:chorismate synthase [bacterium]|nr:chorismate synthase [bacterium]
MFRFLSAGESHGPSLSVIIEGMPAGLVLPLEKINRELARRQKGYGRGDRMLIEKDRVRVTSGMRHGETLGSPITLVIENRDWKNWEQAMDPEKLDKSAAFDRIHRPRPGHADLVGGLKYDRSDFRDILERASARETATRVAAGAVAKVLLAAFGVELGSWVDQIGGIHANLPTGSPARLAKKADQSDTHCPDETVSRKIHTAIDRAQHQGDTLGGVFTVSAWGLVPGLGSHAQWDRRLDMAIAGAMMSIPAMKGVAFGLGFDAAQLPGSKVHDVITYRKGGKNGGFSRRTNNAGGVEGGISTGEPLLVRVAMKPISTLRKPLKSIDMQSKRALVAGYERSDVCAVPAAAVVGEAMLAMELVKKWQEKFGGDSLSEMRANWKTYQRYLDRR